jgi:hypothetical protein
VIESHGNTRLRLGLTDPGFDHSVLSEFRSRLVEGHAEQRLLDLLLERCREGGWVKARGRQRDRLDAYPGQDPFPQPHGCRVAQTMVYVLNVLSEVAPDWIRAHVPDEWVERYGQRLEEERLPKEQERQQYANQVGADGWLLLEALESADTPDWMKTLPAIATLRTMWEQQAGATRAGWAMAARAGSASGSTPHLSL